MRLTLSHAIRVGDEIAPERPDHGYIEGTVASCPLGAAFLGTLHGPADLQKFMGLLGNSSYEPPCQFIHHGLMKTFPILGWSLRELPAFKRAVGRDAPPAIVYERGGLTRRHPPSLFATITHLHDTLNWSKAQVADLLAVVGL